MDELNPSSSKSLTATTSTYFQQLYPRDRYMAAIPTSLFEPVFFYNLKSVFLEDKIPTLSYRALKINLKIVTKHKSKTK